MSGWPEPFLVPAPVASGSTVPPSARRVSSRIWRHTCARDARTVRLPSRPTPRRDEPGFRRRRRSTSPFFCPWIFRACPPRIIRALRPAVLALIETELWPNLLHEALERDLPVSVINGRLSPERMVRYRRLRAAVPAPRFASHRRGSPDGARMPSDSPHWACRIDPSRSRGTSSTTSRLPMSISTRFAIASDSPTRGPFWSPAPREPARIR